MLVANRVGPLRKGPMLTGMSTPELPNLARDAQSQMEASGVR